MIIKNGVQLDKEIREGWTIKDFIDEIDTLVFNTMFGRTIYNVPKDRNQLSVIIENFIPKHMFTNQKQINQVVKDLTRYYAYQWGMYE